MTLEVAESITEPSVATGMALAAQAEATLAQRTTFSVDMAVKPLHNAAKIALKLKSTVHLAFEEEQLDFWSLDGGRTVSLSGTIFPNTGDDEMRAYCDAVGTPITLSVDPKALEAAVKVFSVKELVTACLLSTDEEGTMLIHLAQGEETRTLDAKVADSSSPTIPDGKRDITASPVDLPNFTKAVAAFKGKTTYVHVSTEGNVFRVAMDTERKGKESWTQQLPVKGEGEALYNPTLLLMAVQGAGIAAKAAMVTFGSNGPLCLETHENPLKVALYVLPQKPMR